MYRNSTELNWHGTKLDDSSVKKFHCSGEQK